MTVPATCHPIEGDDPVNDDYLDQLGEPEPVLPLESHPVADLAADVMLAAVIGFAVFCAVLALSWVWPW